jgi:hypothetical protein
MQNYGEELAFWYLRLNGFFPIANFVVHGTGPRLGEYTGEVDLIAVRWPFVSERIGGGTGDWDNPLMDLFVPNVPIGLLCEVKTGNFGITELFRDEIVSSTLSRFGFASNYDAVIDSVQERPLSVVNNRFQIGKILFSNRAAVQQDAFFHISLSHARGFIQDRIRAYPREKYQDRMYFSSTLVQYLIDTTVREVGRGPG